MTADLSAYTTKANTSADFLAPERSLCDPHSLSYAGGRLVLPQGAQWRRNHEEDGAAIARKSHAGRHGRVGPRQGDPGGRPRARAVSLLRLQRAIESGLIHHRHKPNMTPHIACADGQGGINMTLNVAVRQGRR